MSIIDPLDLLFVRASVTGYLEGQRQGLPDEDNLNLASYASSVLPKLADELEAERLMRATALRGVTALADAIRPLTPMAPAHSPYVVILEKLDELRFLLDPAHQDPPPAEGSELEHQRQWVRRVGGADLERLVYG